MRQIIQAQLFILLFANVALASEERIQESQYRFVGDERAMSICAAAIKSKTDVVAEAKRLHLTRKSLKEVSCNGQSLTDFAEANQSILGSKAIAIAR